MFNFFKKKEADTPQLFFKTDIHCHVIPGIDDGSDDLETSLDLVKRMQAWGINRILATPHVTMESFENTPETVTPPFEALKAAIDKEGLGIELGHSAEYRIDEYSISQIQSGIVMPYPNKYLLVENSFIQEPWNLRQTLFDLMLKDYKLIWAHPERYTYYHDKDKRGVYEEIHNIGVKFQVNILSLAGAYGKAEKKIAEELIEKNLVDFIGTDLHRHRHADAIDEYLKSKDYRRHRAALEGRILNDEAFN